MLSQLAAAYDSKSRLVRQSDATHSVLGKADSVSEEMHILEHCKALCYRWVGCAKDFSGVGMRSLIWGRGTSSLAGLFLSLSLSLHL